MDDRTAASSSLTRRASTRARPFNHTGIPMAAEPLNEMPLPTETPNANRSFGEPSNVEGPPRESHVERPPTDGRRCRVVSVNPFLLGYPFRPGSGGRNKAVYQLHGGLSVRDDIDLIWYPIGDPKHHEPLATRHPETGGQFTLWNIAMPRGGGVVGRVTQGVRECVAMATGRRPLGNLLTDPAVDIVHVHHSHPAPPWMRDARHRRAGNATRLLSHHSGGLSNQLRHYDHVVFVSEHQRRLAIQGGYPADRTSVIYYPCDPAFLSDELEDGPEDGPKDEPKNGPRNAGSPTDRSRIIYVGNLIRRKNPDRVVSAVNRLDDCPADVVGSGELDAASRRQDVGGRCTFHGRRSAEQVATLMRHAAACVMPSVSEGLALGYIEAVCSGVPIIGYPPNVSEIAERLGCEVGYAFDAEREDDDALAELIRSVRDPAGPWADPERRRRLRDRARRHFSLERFVDSYAALYRRLSGSTPSARRDEDATPAGEPRRAAA